MACVQVVTMPLLPVGTGMGETQELGEVAVPPL